MPRTEILKPIAMYESLQKAIKDAGGSDTVADSVSLSKMTLPEFLYILSCNNIGFVYRKPTDGTL